MHQRLTGLERRLHQCRMPRPFPQPREDENNVIDIDEFLITVETINKILISEDEEAKFDPLHEWIDNL